MKLRLCTSLNKFYSRLRFLGMGALQKRQALPGFDTCTAGSESFPLPGES